jgi:hypothetical protein
MIRYIPESGTLERINRLSIILYGTIVLLLVLAVCMVVIDRPELVYIFFIFLVFFSASLASRYLKSLRALELKEKEELRPLRRRTER